MQDIDFFYFNKLSYLHDNTKIFFCKTDYIFDDFDTISKIKNPVVLITGNSDYGITDGLLKTAPNNIKTWYCQNALTTTNDEKIIPLPLGIENKIFSYRENHGIGHGSIVEEKERTIKNLFKKNPKRYIYANFNISTNPKYRNYIKNYIKNIQYIDFEEPNLSINDLYNRFANYKMVLCPAGNGIDTHRLWECLYCGIVPITIKIGEYKIYKLYEKLPIVLLENITELSDTDIISTKYNEAIQKYDNLNLLNSKYWEKTISDTIN